MSDFAPRIGDAIGNVMAGLAAAVGSAGQGATDALAGAAANGAIVLVVGAVVVLLAARAVLRH